MTLIHTKEQMTDMHSPSQSRVALTEKMGSYRERTQWKGNCNLQEGEFYSCAFSKKHVCVCVSFVLLNYGK